MGSTLTELRNLLARQIDYTDLTTTTDPSTTELNDYINKSVRKLVRRDKPQELRVATPATADITSGTNTATIPSTIFVPDQVYYKDNGGRWKQLRQLSVKHLIDRTSSGSFFDTNNQGNPEYYAIRSNTIIFDRYFSRTESAALKVYGLSIPTKLANNIVVNGDNEAAVVTVDTQTNGTISQSFTEAYTGNSSAKFVMDATIGTHSFDIELVASTKYNVSVWLYVPTATVSSVIVSSNNVTLGTVSAKDTWTNVTGNFTAVASDKLTVRYSGGSGSGLFWYTDDIEIIPGGSGYDDEVDLPIDYDMLITYESAVLFYQKDDDLENQLKYQALADQERAELKLSLSTNNQDLVQLDPYTFVGSTTNMSNPNLFFGP